MAVSVALHAASNTRFSAFSVVINEGAKTIDVTVTLGSVGTLGSLVFDGLTLTANYTFTIDILNSSGVILTTCTAELLDPPGHAEDADDPSPKPSWVPAGFTTSNDDDGLSFAQGSAIPRTSSHFATVTPDELNDDRDFLNFSDGTVLQTQTFDLSFGLRENDGTQTPFLLVFRFNTLATTPVPPPIDEIPCCDTGCGCEEGPAPGPITEPPDDVPLPPWVPQCTGGGSAPSAADPVNSESWLTGPKSPSFWLEIAKKAYPSGTVTTRRISTKTLLFPTYIAGRVVRGGWSRLTKALSDWRGNLEASRFSAVVDDGDGEVRGDLSDYGTAAYAVSETLLKLLSEAGRKAGLSPRVIHRGRLDRPQLEPWRRATLEMTDILGSALLPPSATFQQVFITREHLEAAGIFGTPKHLLDKPYNIVIGEHGDDGAVDKTGASAEKGLVPGDYLGTITVSGSTVIPDRIDHIFLPPPILTVTYVGTESGTNRYTYAVSALTATGESKWSNVVTIENMPDYKDLDVSNYIELNWTWPAGFERIYAENVIAFRVGGRTTRYEPDGVTVMPPAHHLDIQNNDGAWINPEYQYRDGEIHGRDEHDEEKLPPAPDVPTARYPVDVPGGPAAETWGVIAASLGYVNIRKSFGSDITAGAVPKRAQISHTDRSDFRHPSHANWPFANPYVEFNGVRLSVVLAKGPLLQHHIDGHVTFAFNVCGATSTGDHTGTMISQLGPAFTLLIDQFFLRKYRTGAFWPLQAFADGTAIVKTSTCEAVQNVTKGFLQNNEGYLFHLCLTEKVTLGQVLQWICLTFNVWIGPTEECRVGMYIIDDRRDTSSDPIYRRKIELPPQLPKGEEARDEVENKIGAKYDWDPDARAYRGDLEPIEDAPSQAMYGLKEVTLEQRCTRDQATARDARARRLLLNRIAPFYQPVRADLRGMEQPMGGYFRLAHPDTLAADGSARPYFGAIRWEIERIDHALPRVTFWGRDIYRTLAFGAPALGEDGTTGTFLIGDETLAAAPPTGPYELR